MGPVCTLTSCIWQGFSSFQLFQLKFFMDFPFSCVCTMYRQLIISWNEDPSAHIISVFLLRKLNCSEGCNVQKLSHSVNFSYVNIVWLNVVWAFWNFLVKTKTKNEKCRFYQQLKCIILKSIEIYFLNVWQGHNQCANICWERDCFWKCNCWMSWALPV